MDVLQKLNDANYIGIVRIIQSLGDAGDIFEYFQSIGMPFMLQFMKDKGMFVAGSYVTSMINKMERNSYIPFFPNDMDIWIPCVDTMDGEDKLMALQSILVRSQHYSLPRNITVNQCYGRLGRIATHIMDFAPRSSTLSLIKIQAILLKPDDRPNRSVQQKASETVMQFDFNICKAFFADFKMMSDDTTCIRHPSFARIGLDNDSMKYQGFSEWIRTEIRMMKYTTRGYMFREDNSLDWWTLMKHALASNVALLQLRTFRSRWNRSKLVDNLPVHPVDKVLMTTNIFMRNIDLEHPLPKLHVLDSEWNRNIRLSWGPFSHEYSLEYIEPLHEDIVVKKINRDAIVYTRYMIIKRQLAKSDCVQIEYEEIVRVATEPTRITEDMIVRQSSRLEGTSLLVDGDTVEFKGTRLVRRVDIE